MNQHGKLDPKTTYGQKHVPFHFLPKKLAKGMQDFVSLQKTGGARQDEKSRKSRRRRRRCFRRKGKPPPTPQIPLPNPSKGGERKLLANLILLLRYCYKRAIKYRHASSLHARHPSLYSRREQTPCNIRQARKLGLPPFGRVGVGVWKARGWLLEDRE